MQPKRTLKYGLTNTFKLRLQLVKKSPPKKYKCMEYHNENLAQPKRLSSYDEKNVGKSFSRGFQQKEIDAMKFSREPVETKALYKRSAKQSPGNNDEQNKEDVMEEKGKKVPISASSGHESKWNDPGFKENSTEDHSGHLDLSNGSFLQDIDYCDDFTSVNTTDGFSPEPISSPITNLQKTKSHSSSSDASRHSKTLPVPAKAENSPQRSLKSTHVIRPRLQTSALSVSSDDDEYLISGKFGQRNTPLVRRGFVGETSSNDSSISSKNMSLKLVQESKDSAPNKPVLMNQSSSDPSHGENEQDNLASLGLDRKYHHISELVVNKLPGYTLQIPGVGKTTLVKKVYEALLLSSGVSVSGFYTEELRERGRRLGFDVVTVSGGRGPLARVSSESATSGRDFRVGQYVVDIQSFESLTLPLFRNICDGSGTRLFVLDEIGKMEMFSKMFIRAVREALDSSYSILGTIPVPKGKSLPLVEEVRSRQDVKIFTVTKENRDVIFDDIVSSVRECLQ
ncbi:hypothetical protein DNTS_029574 [Danionella cerebrum]|uniref:AAA+ ATPase domain-containing protein n=1 Tax=Danionella cerebrum TaxID=2873325 RepID=A0A553QRH0_9TELE|nr:hypothetical protein DNTS_029574 [Danionella translucida]